MISPFTYDDAGNLLRDDRASYTYDAFNRQTKAEMFDGNIQINRYDPEGLRYEMEENGRLVQFIFRDKEVIAEESEAGTVRYIRTHELLASDAESARTYYHYASDELGSITHVTEGEEVLNRYGYDAWGDIVAREEAVENRFCFAGEQYDPVSRQYYLRARFYNPVIGRFTQEDTYRGDGLNLYAYCRNNPVYYVDPSGHFCLSMAEKILAAISEGTVAGNDLEKLKKYLAEKKKLNDGEKRVAEKLGVNCSDLKKNNKTFASSSEITKDVRKNKPLNSPDIDEWYKKNGTISINENDIWTYNDWEGHSVSYPGGYPDFMSAGLVKQEAPIGPFSNRKDDFAKAKKLGYIKDIIDTWHHNEDGITLQAVERKLHQRFTHRGGISIAKKKN